MRVYRICRAEHVATALTGIGAASYPGRWNSKGVHLVYTAGSHSLALLEPALFVGASAPPYRESLVRSAQRYRDEGAVVVMEEFFRARWPGYSRAALEQALPGASEPASADAGTTTASWFDSSSTRSERRTSPACWTTSICSASAEKKTSAEAPARIWRARSLDAPRLRRNVRPDAAA